MFRTNIVQPALWNVLRITGPSIIIFSPIFLRCMWLSFRGDGNVCLSDKELPLYCPNFDIHSSSHGQGDSYLWGKTSHHCFQPLHFTRNCWLPFYRALCCDSANTEWQVSPKQDHSRHNVIADEGADLTWTTKTWGYGVRLVGLTQLHCAFLGTWCSTRPNWKFGDGAAHKSSHLLH